MRYGLGERIKVVNINYDHKKRDTPPLPKVLGMYGVIFKVSLIDDNA